MGSAPYRNVTQLCAGFLLQTPLVYNYGDPSPSANQKYYDTLVQEMADSVYKHFKRNRKGKIDI